MDILVQILVGIGAITLIIVIGSFLGISMAVLDDMIAEREQERERSRWRTKK